MSLELKKLLDFFDLQLFSSRVQLFPHGFKQVSEYFIFLYSTGPSCTKVEYISYESKNSVLNFDYQITLFSSCATMLLENFFTSAPFKIYYFLQPRDDVNNTKFAGQNNKRR